MLLAASPSHIKAFMMGRPAPAQLKIIDKGAYTVLPIRGVIGRGAWFDQSPDDILAMIEEAGNAKSRGVILDIDSPGGEVSAIDDILAALDGLKATKTIVAYTSGMMLSLGYYIGVAASKIVASPNASVGSIGTYISLLKKSEDDWVVDVVSSQSPDKIPDPENPDQLRELQAYVDQCADNFLSAIATYRGGDAASVQASYGGGKILLAKQALSNGMVDYVSNMAGAIKIATGKGVPEEPKPTNEIPRNQSAQGKIMKIFAQIKGKSAKLKALAEGEAPSAEAVETDAIDLAWLEANLPDLVEQIKELGREEERMRIEEIEALDDSEGDEEEKEMVAKAKADAKIKAADLAVALLKHRKSASASGKVIKHPSATNMANARREDAASAFAAQGKPANAAEKQNQAEEEALKRIEARAPFRR